MPETDTSDGLAGLTALTKDNSLPVIQVAGFGASIDAFAWESDAASETPRMVLWFVSLLGPQQALKAIGARLLMGELATVSRAALNQVRFCSLAPHGPKGWRTLSARLPASAGHQLVLLPELARIDAARDDFLLLPRSEDETAGLHFRFLDRRVDVPLHASWASWVWERALRTGEAVALEAEGILAYRCHPDSVAMVTDVSAAVRSGQLVIPDADEEILNGTPR